MEVREESLEAGIFDVLSREELGEELPWRGPPERLHLRDPAVRWLETGIDPHIDRQREQLLYLVREADPGLFVYIERRSTGSNTPREAWTGGSQLHASSSIASETKSVIC